MTQLTTPETIAAAIGALAGVLSFLSAVLPKASEEETIVNNILNLIHGAGFNSGKIVLPKSQAAISDENKALISVLNSATTLLKEIENPATVDKFVMPSASPTVPPPSATVNPATSAK